MRNPFSGLSTAANPFAVLFERRSGAITDSHSLWEYLARGSRSLAGVNVNENTALSLAAVSTCVRIISRSIATLPADILERRDEKTRVPAKKHWARALISRPNGWQTWQDFLLFVVVHLLLRGNAYFRIIRSSTNPKEISQLLPLHPDRMAVKQAPFPDLSLEYEYSSPDGRTIKLSQRDVLHFRNLSTNGVVGRSVLEDHRETFGAGIATQTHAATFWGKGGLPSVVLHYPKALKDAAKTNLENSWAAKYGGNADQSRVAVLEEGTTVEPLSPKLADMQYIETRGFNEGEIFGIYQVPRFLSGNTEKATTWGTGIEQQFIGFLTLCLAPYVVGIEQRFNADILGDTTGEFQLKLFFQGFLRGDSTSRALYYRVMREVGAMNADDIRAFEDMNPIPDGKGQIYLQPTNLAPIGWAPTPKGNQE